MVSLRQCSCCGVIHVFTLSSSRISKKKAFTRTSKSSALITRVRAGADEHHNRSIDRSLINMFDRRRQQKVLVTQNKNFDPCRLHASKYFARSFARFVYRMRQHGL